MAVACGNGGGDGPSTLETSRVNVPGRGGPHGPGVTETEIRLGMTKRSHRQRGHSIRGDHEGDTGLLRQGQHRRRGSLQEKARPFGRGRPLHAGRRARADEEACRAGRGAGDDRRPGDGRPPAGRGLPERPEHRRQLLGRGATSSSRRAGRAGATWQSTRGRSATSRPT